ncbi:MAG: alpha/beta hydrolase [Alphaproteobacteria bacterium]|nr:alpha/beta hydrolase [Alphaproteobacteria bacterium]
MVAPTGFDQDLLPVGVRSRFVSDNNGLNMHVLEAGHEEPGRELLVLLHGFPELAYSWRKVMVRLAEAGYHVVAPDQRGYGLTTGWVGDYHSDIAPFRLFNLVRDVMGLVHALGHESVASVIGHDFGSPVAAWCSLIRPDIFKSVVLMSAPIGQAASIANAAGGEDVHAAMAALPRPRKHYQWYYSTPEANGNMLHCPQGLHDFLRAYYHHKSAEWAANTPYPLKGWTAAELAKLPTYYIMDLDRGMAETVADEMPSAKEIASCTWLPEVELGVYSSTFGRTGFQGGLNWYRCATSSRFTPELELFSGRTIDVPSMYVAGKSDWGVHQKPGDFERMQEGFCTDMRGCHLVDGAGHWVQQERPDEVVSLVSQFLRSLET